MAGIVPYSYQKVKFCLHFYITENPSTQEPYSNPVYKSLTDNQEIFPGGVGKIPRPRNCRKAIFPHTTLRSWQSLRFAYKHSN